MDDDLIWDNSPSANSLILPVTPGQFRLWRHGNQPIGFVTWAFVNDEIEERLRRGDVKLRPLDWKSGRKRG